MSEINNSYNPLDDLYFDFSLENKEGCGSWNNDIVKYKELKHKLEYWPFSSPEEVAIVKKQLKELEKCINITTKKLSWLKKESQKSIPDKSNINYLDYIDENWISEDNKEIIFYFWNKLWLENIPEEKKEWFIKWFVFLLKLFTEIESDWENIKNNNWSSAKWYFQFLTWNWSNWYEVMIKWKNQDWEFHEVWKTKYYALKKSSKQIYRWRKISKFNIRHKKSSYELSLFRTKEYYIETKKNLPTWLENIGNKWPIDLTIDQQTTLFLVDLFTKNKKYRWLWIEKFLPLAIDWNEWWVKKLYYVFHHTHPDKATKERISKIINKHRTILVSLRKNYEK